MSGASNYVRQVCLCRRRCESFALQQLLYPAQLGLCMQALHVASRGVLHIQWHRAQYHSVHQWGAEVPQVLQLLHPLRGAAVLRCRQPR